MLTLAPITRSPKAFAPAVAPLTLATSPDFPPDCLRDAQAARLGDVVLVTVDVVDGAGALVYRILDRFVRDATGLVWTANVGAGPAPAIVLQTSRSFGA